jgi:transcriptional regulatory protein GAL4
MEIIPRPKHRAWHVLLYIIAALGAFTTAESPTDVDVALFQAAKARISIDMLETGNLAFVQALTLISNYVQKRNKPNSGYNYTGLAKRVALGIGLHKEFAIWHTKPLMLEMRRRVWWALYVFDVGACITFSRPLDSPEGGVEVNLPLNVHDTDITASTRQTPQEINEVTLYSHVRCQSQFHIASGPIYARLLSTPFPESKELMDMDDQCIAQWVTDLPDYFKEDVQQPPKYRLCHAILRWRYRNFRILMYRHFVIRHIMLKAQQTNGNQQVHQEVVSHYDNLAIQRCLDAASQTVDLITTFWQQERRSMMACWYSLYFLFQAILVPVICLRNEPQSIQAMSWRDQIFRASQVIADMANLNPAAVRCHNTITSLCGAYLGQSPSNSAWGEPVQESPQTQLNGLYPFMWPMLDGFQSDGYDSALHESAIHDFMNQISGMQ